ncbi:MAG: DUF4123 domain-containing protein, partial [Starkeya sp.]|nr:DUF4123 domain-containing protein [Starkeya sp.]
MGQRLLPPLRSLPGRFLRNGSPGMSPLEHWLREQSRMHRQLYLVLDADGNTEALQALLNSPPAAPHVSLYAGTEAAPLAARGPFVMQLANRATPALATLLAHPERHWGMVVLGMGKLGAVELNLSS